MNGGLRNGDEEESPDDGLDLACQLQSLAVLLEIGAQKQPLDRAARLLDLARLATYTGWELETLLWTAAESTES